MQNGHLVCYLEYRLFVGPDEGLGLRLKIKYFATKYYRLNVINAKYMKRM